MWKSRSMRAMVVGLALCALSFSAAQAVEPTAPSPEAKAVKYQTAHVKNIVKVPFSFYRGEVAASEPRQAAETFTINKQPEVAVVASKAYATSLVASVPERPRPVHSAELNIAMISTSTLGAGAMPSRMQLDPDPHPRAANFVDIVLSAAIGRYGAGLV